MVIIDIKGLYILKLEGNIVFEELRGSFDNSDVDRLHNEYVYRLLPQLKGKQWTKCSDIRNYAISSINESGFKHLEWCKDNGMQPGAIVVSNSIVKMQMNRFSKDNNLTPVAFTELEEAKEWLKSKGY